MAASLGPDIPLGEGMLRLRPEDILTVVMIGLLLLKFLTEEKWAPITTVLNRVVLFVFGLSIVAALAIFLKSPLETDPSIATGAFGYGWEKELVKEIIRFAKYILVALSFILVPPRTWKPALRTLVICCAIMIGIQVIQYSNPERINPLISNVYTPHASIMYSTTWAKEEGQFRTGSLFGNPNVFGAYLIGPFFICGMLFLRSFKTASKKGRRSRLSWLSLTTLIWLGIFLAQSRTVLFALIFGIGVSFFSTPPLLRRKFRRLGGWVLITILITFAAFARTTGRYSLKGLMGGFGEQSFSHKTEITFDRVKELGSLIVVGASPAGAAMVDNEWGYMITWYGLIGVLFYLLFYYSLFKMMSRRIQDVYLCAAFQGILAAYFIGAVGSSFLLNNRIFPIFIVLLSLAIAKKDRPPLP